MRNLFGALAKEGSLGIMILIVLIALVWLGGKYLGWDDQLMILLTIGVLLLFLVVFITQKLLAVKRAMNIENQLRMQAQAHVQSTIPDKQPEIEALQQQFNEALASLKQSGLGKDALYKLPWYPIIGPPGAGKSTALQESGLNFPSMGTGPRAIRGIGGTRNCDWWFTDEGILLDTAGRYTTEMDDQQEWFSFLDLLRKSRPQKPINGAIVAISIADIVSSTDAQIEEYSGTIRDRLDELSKRLGTIFPVYLMFTKCDLLQGFVEFFEDFGKSERSQVWGVTMKYTSNPGRTYEEIFYEETKVLADNLRSRRIGALGTERPVKKKQNVYLFPLQFEMAQKRLADFIGQLFRPNPFQESAILRGFYFTSGTQKGTPIDQVIAALSKAMGSEVPPEEQAEPAIERKSFFLKDLFTKIIFQDKFLARPTASVRKKNKLIRLATVGASLAFLGFCALFTTISFAANSTLLYTAKSAGTKVRELEKENPNDLLENLIALDDLKGELESLDSDKREGPNVSKRFFLYRGGDVNEDLRRVYFGRIKTFFIVPMKKKMEQDLLAMRDKEIKSIADSDRMFDVIRAYQMLALNEDKASREKGQMGMLAADNDVLKRVLDQQGYWLAGPNASGKVTPELGQLAKNQMEFLLTQLDREDDWRLKIDKELVERINQYLSGAIWLTESYNDIVNLDRGFVDRNFVLQVDGRKYLEVRDQKGDFKFSANYTQQVWNSYVANAIKDKSRSLSERFEQLRKKRTPEEIEKELIDIYQRDYARLWTEFHKNLKVLPFANLNEAAARLKVLCTSGPESAIREFLKNVSDQQQLKVSATENYNRSTIDMKVVDEILKKMLDLQAAIETFNTTATEGSRFTGQDAAKLAALVAAFDTCVSELSKALDRVATDTAERQRIGDVFRQLIGNAAEAARGDCLAESNKYWSDNVATPFKTDFADKFPFKEDAQASVPLATFSKMFNPTISGTNPGTIAQTVAKFLTLSKTKVNGEPLLKLSPDFLRDVEPAGRITNALYPNDSPTISLPFTATLKQRGYVSDMKLDIGGDWHTMYKDRSNRERTYQYVWKEDKSGAKLELQVNVGAMAIDTGETFSFSKDPWGAMRLFYKGSATTTDDVKYTFLWKTSLPISGKLQDVEGEIELTAKDKINPFKKGFFAQFKCPTKVGP